MEEIIDNLYDKYDTFFNRGRLCAVDLDTGVTYFVRLKGKRIFSSRIDEDCPYALYEIEDGLMCINLDTGDEYTAELERYDR